MGEIIDKAKGRAKQVEGSITGDKGKQAEGQYDEAKGNVKGKVEELKQSVKDTFRRDPNTRT